MTVNNGNAATDIQKLHQNLSEWLNRVGGVIENAGTRIPQNQAEYQVFQRDIRKATEQVENLELTTSIVAPMKAGKSTILNAIAGQDLLPNRAAAMTTIPTEIVFDGNLAEPQLILDPEFISIFEETINQLNIKVQTIGREAAEHKIQQFPHLRNLLERIQDGNHLSFQAETSGREAIRQSLTDINDLIRLCTWISPRLNPLDRVSQIPRIETPFVSFDNEENGKNTNNYLGKLVLVDTPGPNEAMEETSTVNLYEIVKRQLRRSLAVLVVLDFTSLKTDAAEKIKREVQEISEYIGKDNLYILVNKIDQRKEGDSMTSERIQEFVQSEFGVSMSGNVQRFFEISARQAFCAIDFLREYQRHPSETDLSEMNQPIVRSLAQEVLGIDWEEDLEDTTPRQLQKKAIRLWEKSRFQPFLKGSIDLLISKAAPKSMNSATKLVKTRLIEIYDFCHFQLSTQKSNVEQLRRTLDDLKNSQESFQASRTILEEVKNSTFPFIRELLRREKDQSIDRYQGEALEREIDEYFKRWGIQLNSQSFSSQAKAERELEKARRCLASYQEKVYREIFENFQQKLEAYNEQYIEPKRQELKSYLELTEAQKSIRKNLGVVLYWKPPELEVGSIFQNAQSFETNVEAKISPWGWMHNVFSFPFQKIFNIPKVNQLYILQLEDIGSIRQRIQSGIDRLFEQITIYLNRTLPQSFEEYEKQVNRVLQSYIDSLEAAIGSEHQSKEELEVVKQSLEFLLEETERYLKEAEAFSSQIEEFL